MELRKKVNRLFFSALILNIILFFYLLASYGYELYSKYYKGEDIFLKTVFGYKIPLDWPFSVYSDLAVLSLISIILLIWYKRIIVKRFV